MPKSNIILGIDPGTLVLGFGIIMQQRQSLCLVEMGAMNLKGIADPYERLYKIHEKVLLLIRTHHPDAFAIEAPFYGKNVQSMLKLGRAQGVALAAALQTGLKACEYSPRKVKKSITGNGNASKEQVSRMLQRILYSGDTEKWSCGYDATDALAVAVCHHFQQQNESLPAKSNLKSWKAFMEKFPEKIIK